MFWCAIVRKFQWRHPAVWARAVCLAHLLLLLTLHFLSSLYIRFYAFIGCCDLIYFDDLFLNDALCVRNDSFAWEVDGHLLHDLFVTRQHFDGSAGMGREAGPMKGWLFAAFQQKQLYKLSNTNRPTKKCDHSYCLPVVGLSNVEALSPDVSPQMHFSVATDFDRHHSKCGDTRPRRSARKSQRRSVQSSRCSPRSRRPTRPCLRPRGHPRLSQRSGRVRQLASGGS